MLMTEIRKEVVGEVTDMQPALSVLAESAKAILGYDVLAKRMEKILVTTETTLLRMTLQSLELSVLNERDVLRYQKEQLIARTTELAQAWMDEVAKAEFDSCVQNGFSTFTGPNWRLTTIHEYRLPVPEFILAKAVQIKEKMPECAIYIEHLDDHPDPFLVVGASKSAYSWQKPEEHYYLDVWAEPKFEGRLNSGESDDDIPF